MLLVWQFQQFVWHGLNGQNTKEGPIKPQKLCHDFLGKKKLTFIHKTLNLLFKLSLHKQAGHIIVETKNELMYCVYCVCHLA